MSLLASIVVLFLAAIPANGAPKVRIGLFTLFKPETLQVRIASGEGASVEAAGLAGNVSLPRGELIWIRLSGSYLNVSIENSHGVIRQSTITDAVRITSDNFTTLKLTLPGKITRAAQGTLSVDAGIGGRGPLRIVLTTDRESAVASVVAAETTRREPQALMALAVVVRTFMVAHAGRHSAEKFDFCDTTHCQLYRGQDDLSDKSGSSRVVDSVARTTGQILRIQGGLVEGYYTAVCGGMTATPSMVWGGTGSYPYSRIKCQWCQASRFNRWERSADAPRVLSSISAFIASNLSSGTELITECDPSGFVQTVTVRDGSKRVVLSSDAFRRAIGLRLGWSTVLSPSFTVKRRGSRFIFRGRGFGSQVGLCEAGAFAQADAGRRYREILSFYYPEADLGEQPK